MAKTWQVDLPVVGYLSVEVEADTEKEAIEKAMESEYSSDDFVEWEAMRHVVQGNVFYGTLSSARAELVDDGEDETDD